MFKKKTAGEVAKKTRKRGKPQGTQMNDKQALVLKMLIV